MPATHFQDLVDDFALLDDWQDKYRYIIDLGKALPALPDALRVPHYKIDGCASQVWLVPQITYSNGNPPAPILHFQGDSDAIIVRGLIAVLQTIYNSKPLSQVLATDPNLAFSALGLQEHLSNQRANGVRSMITHIHSLALKHSAGVS